MEAHFQDWLFRYQFIYRTRQSNQPFLRSFITDIRAIRKDVKVVDYNEKKYHSRTIYVGNITHTRKIVCTYYDTPPAYTSNYFTREEELSTEKESTQTNLSIKNLIKIINQIKEDYPC